MKEFPFKEVLTEYTKISQCHCAFKLVVSLEFNSIIVSASKTNTSDFQLYHKKHSFEIQYAQEGRGPLGGQEKKKKQA